MSRRLTVICLLGAAAVSGAVRLAAWVDAGRLPAGVVSVIAPSYVAALPDMPLEEIVAARGWRSIPNVNVLVEKSRWMLSIRSGDEVLKSYPVALGSEDMSDKQRRDDGLTPEGEFYICQRNLIADSHAWDSVWLRLSYPNAEDAERGLAEGIITREQAEEIERAIGRHARPPQDTDLGSGIGIHAGGINPRTWTMGCIALQHPHAVEVYRHTRMRTPVTIRG